MSDTMLSVVIPIYCEEEVIPALHERLSAVLDGLDVTAEIVYVDDGSTDGSLARLKALAGKDTRVKVIELARNFGLPAAVTAGLASAGGDAVVLMDGDLQDPPELIPMMVQKWREGYQVVNALKRRRPEFLLKRVAFRAFYALFRGLADVDLPVGCGLFSLMDRKVAEHLCGLRERHRFIPALRQWVGFKQYSLTFDREERYAGKPRQSLAKLLRLGLDGIFSFSSRPLTLAFLFGLCLSALSMAGIVTIVCIKLFTDAAIPGWASNMVTTLFMGGVQLTVLGIVGEYIGRIYNEVKDRPLYVVKSITGGGGEPEEDEAGPDPNSPAT